jgi:hypothetical protein
MYVINIHLLVLSRLDVNDSLLPCVNFIKVKADNSFSNPSHFGKSHYGRKNRCENQIGKTR